MPKLIVTALLALAPATPAAPHPAANPRALLQPAPVRAVIAQGDSGPLVAALQRTLRAAGFSLPVTGTYASATARAWRSFARASLLPHTITPDTVARLGLDTLALATWPSLTPASSRTRVRTFQRALTQAGFPLIQDGRFGPRTEAAYTAWRTQTGLPPSTPPRLVDEQAAVRLGLFTPPSPQPRFDAFPLAVPCFFAATFGHPRPGGRTHEGVDLIAAEGSPVLAPFAGTVTKLRPDTGSISGNSLRVTAPDGSYVFFAHLAGFAPGVTDGTPVIPGQPLGSLGRTGTTSPHLHLEWHPHGGPPVDPFALLVRSGSCT